MLLFKPRLIILTTKTNHHIYYINKIAKEFPIEAVFFENDYIQPEFPIGPLFENEQSVFEKMHFFKDTLSDVDKKTVIIDVPTVNVPSVIGKIKDYNADIGIVFGCGKIKSHMLTATKDGLINIHRGIASEYRGLDSDLWSIYHYDYNNIGVTIHKVDNRLDTGDILKIQKLYIRHGMKIHQLRYYLTIMAVKMTLDILREYKKTRKLNGIPQYKIGRYYSFMPLVLKKIIQARFNKYTEKLTII